MERTTIPIKTGENLSGALKNEGYKTIPTNSILRKVLPGLGATFMEISDEISKRHSIIIEPNVPVITGKTKNNPKVLGVIEGVTKDKIESYLKNKDITYKKILTTPESYHLIKEVIQSPTRRIKMNLYKDFFCLYDECEKLIQDVDYRDKITQPMNDFFLFEGKAMVSATPLTPSDPRFKEHSFKILEIEPDYNYKKNLNLIITNTYEEAVLRKFEELKDSECICIFLNKTDSIDKLINSLGIVHQSKIFCSDKSAKKLKKKGYDIASDKIELPLAKYNFFTCRFFSAVDIELRKKPDVLMLTNLKDASYTMIDPFTEAIQIYGRFRKKYHGNDIPFNSLTHITTFNINYKAKTIEEIGRTIDTYKRVYEDIQEQINNSSDDIEKEALRKDLEKLNYAEFLDDAGNYNYFSQDNFYNEERVKNYYSNPQLLLQAYKDTEHFIVTEQIQDSPYVFDWENFRKKNKSTSELRKNIIIGLEEFVTHKKNNPSFNIELQKQLFRNIEITKDETGELMVDCFDYLGKEKIDKIGYTSPKKLKKALVEAKAEKKEKDSFFEIQNRIKEIYKIEDKKTKNEYKELLIDIYKEFGLEDINITQSTIEIYCHGKSDNGKKPAEFRITAFKTEYGEKL